MIKVIAGSFLLGSLTIVALLQYTVTSDSSSDFENRVNELPVSLIEEKKRLIKLMVDLKGYEDTLAEDSNTI